MMVVVVAGSTTTATQECMYFAFFLNKGGVSSSKAKVLFVSKILLFDPRVCQTPQPFTDIDCFHLDI